MRYSKYILLGLGTPLVLVGSRLFIDGVSSGSPWGILVLALFLFFVGKTLVRFEDFPQGREIVDKMDTQLEARKEMFQYITTSVKASSQKVGN